MTQVVEQLPSKREALSSNPRTTRKYELLQGTFEHSTLITYPRSRREKLLKNV
jgi:hypothetical protein